MRATRALYEHAARQPMIRFLGKRSVPKQVDHTPTAHPASPTHSLPESFASYRSRVQSHGPLGGSQSQSTSTQSPSSQSSVSASTSSSTHPPSGSAAAQTAHPYGAIGGHSGKELGSVQPKEGEVWDRNELPKRFHRARWTQSEIDALESGGASLFA